MFNKTTRLLLRKKSSTKLLDEEKIVNKDICMNIPLLLILSLLCSLIVLVSILSVGVENILGFVGLGNKLLEGGMSPFFIFSVLSALLIALVPVATYLFVTRTKLFMTVLVLAFSYSEIQIPIVHYVAFGLRYLLMFAVIVLGIYQLIKRDIKFKLLEKVALLLLFWQIVVLIVGGMHMSSLTMMPIQIFLLLGIIIGLRFKYRNLQDILDLAKIFAWCGLILTFTHVISVASPDSFNAGRFQSFYSLPTNFANSYILLLVPMIWMSITEKKFKYKMIFIGAAILGIVLLLMSGTRNAMGFLMVSILLFSYIWKKKMGIYVAVAGLLVIASIPVFLANSQSLDFLSKRLTHIEGGSANARENVWKLSLELIKEKPMMGYGLGRVMDQMEKNVVKWAVLNTHNAYLGIWFQIGVFGLVFTLLIYFIVLFKGYKILIFGKTRQVIKEILILPLALLSGLFASGMFEENLTSRGSIQQLIWALSIVMIYMLCNVRKTVK